MTKFEILNLGKTTGYLEILEEVTDMAIEECVHNERYIDDFCISLRDLKRIVKRKIDELT